MFRHEKQLTSSLTCCARLYRLDKGTFLVLGCMAKHGVRESMVSRLASAVSPSSLRSGDVQALNTFSTGFLRLGPLDISALRPQKAETTRNK